MNTLHFLDNPDDYHPNSDEKEKINKSIIWNSTQQSECSVSERLQVGLLLLSAVVAPSELMIQ